MPEKSSKRGNMAHTFTEQEKIDVGSTAQMPEMTALPNG